MKQGLDKESASIVVYNLHRVEEVKSSRAKKDMLYGGFLFVAGIVVTVITYSSASPSGSWRFVIACGAIIFGAIQFFRGASKA